MVRRFVPLIGFFAVWGIGLVPAPAQAQVNIDQGKSASEMFSSTCVTCHKSAKGLANGRNSTTLTSFLREHYTSSAQQATALAAYVLGAGAGPAPTANLKPGTAGAADQKTGEAKPGEKTRQGRPEPASTARLQPPAEPGTRTEAEPANAPVPPGSVPGASSRKPAGAKHEPHPVTASRGPRQEPETPPPEPEAAPVTAPPVAEPMPAPAPAPVATPEPAAPAPVATAPATSEPSASVAPAEPQPAMPTTAATPGAVPEGTPAPVAAAPSAKGSSVIGSNHEASPTADTGASAETPMEGAPEGTPAEAAPVPRDDIPD